MFDRQINPNEWDNFMPFEKTIYIDLLINKLKEENKSNQKQQAPPPTEKEFM